MFQIIHQEELKLELGKDVNKCVHLQKKRDI